MKSWFSTLRAWNAEKLDEIVRIQPCTCERGRVKHNEKGGHY